MSNVANELMLEVLKDLQSGQADIKVQLHSIQEELGAVRTHMAGFQADINNLYTSQAETKRGIRRQKATCFLPKDVANLFFQA